MLSSGLPTKMADASEIAKLLNQFRDTGMVDLASETEISDVITDYMTKRIPEEDDEPLDIESEEESEATPTELPSLTGPVPAENIPVPEAEPEPVDTTDSDRKLLFSAQCFLSVCCKR